MKKFLAIGLLLGNQEIVFAQAETLRVLLSPVKNVWTIDPPKINSAEAHVLTKLVFPTLIDWDDETGQIVSGLAERFYWKGSDLYFELRKNYKSSKGDIASADDLIFSFKRLFDSTDTMSLPGHIDTYLCDRSKKEKKLECPHIEKINNLTVKFHFPIQNAAFVDYFANSRYSILLEKTVDPKTQKIVDYKNTLGPYRLESDRDQSIVMLANEQHWKIKKDSPKALEFWRPKTSLSNDEKFQLLKTGKIDYIGLSSGLNHETFNKIKDEFKSAGSYVITDELGSVNLVFSKQAMKKFSEEDRRIVSKIIQGTINKKRSSLPAYKRPTEEFLIPGSYGSFTLEQKQQLQDLRKKLPDAFSQKLKIKIGVSSKGWADGIGSLIEPIKPNVDIVIYDRPNFYDFLKSDSSEAPDLIATTNDMSFHERFSHVGWLLDVNYFNIRDEQAKVWLQKYSQISDKTVRNGMWNKLHFDSVAINPSVIPIYTIPARAVAVNGWKLDRYIATSPEDSLWQIHK